MSHIFISYARKDAHFAHYLEDCLLRSGFDVWIDDHNIKYGQDWETAIFQAVKSCAVLVVVMTTTSANSSWVRREGIYADKLGKPIIPLLREGDPFPRYLDLHYVDVTEPNKLPSSFLKQLAQYAPRKSTRGQNLALNQQETNSSSGMSPHLRPTTYDPRLRKVGAASLIAFALLIVAVLVLLALNNPASKTSATQTANALVKLPTEARAALVVDTPVLTNTTIAIENTLPEPTLTVELTSQAITTPIQSTDTESPSTTAANDLSPTPPFIPFIFTPTLARMTAIPAPVSNFSVSNPGGSQVSVGVSAPVVNQNTSSLPTSIVLPTKPGNNNPIPPTATHKPAATNTPKPPTATRTPSLTPTLTLTPTPTDTTQPGTLQVVSSFFAPGEWPNGLTCDGQFLWLSDNSATIFKMDMSGNVLAAYDAPEGTSEGIVWAVDRFYLQTSNRNKVYTFQIQNGSLKTLSTFDGPGQVTGTSDMAWDGANIWYSLNYDVYKLDSNGAVVGGFAYGKTVNGLAWDGTSFWMGYGYSHDVLQVNHEGQGMATYQIPFSEVQGLDWCNNILWAVGRDQATYEMKVYQLRR